VLLARALKISGTLNKNKTRHEVCRADGEHARHATEPRSPTHDQGNDEVSDIQTDFPPGKDEPASIADASPARSYAARIVNSWRHAADAMMEVAQLCCEASERLTASEKKQLIKRLPFKEATFSKFVQIGKDARLQKLHARRLLPPHYTIAYPLTRLTDEQLQTAVKQGVINPDMKRADLQGWLKAHRLWRQTSSPTDHPAPIVERADAEVAAAQDEQAFAALEAAWNAAPAFQTAWTSATDPARERFVREVLRVSTAPAAPSSQAQ
jgi:hypothetical protein